MHWLKQVQEGVITQLQAAERMDVSEPWVRELVRRYERVGRRGCGARGAEAGLELADRGSEAKGRGKAVEAARLG